MAVGVRVLTALMPYDFLACAFSYFAPWMVRGVCVCMVYMCISSICNVVYMRYRAVLLYVELYSTGTKVSMYGICMCTLQ